MGIRIGPLEDCHKLSEPTVDTARCHAVPHVSKMLDVKGSHGAVGHIFEVSA
jgi:hypothetical protein